MAQDRHLDVNKINKKPEDKYSLRFKNIQSLTDRNTVRMTRGMNRGPLPRTRNLRNQEGVVL